MRGVNQAFVMAVRRGLMTALPVCLILLFLLMLNAGRYPAGDTAPEATLFLADSRQSPPLPRPQSRGRTRGRQVNFVKETIDQRRSVQEAKDQPRGTSPSSDVRTHANVSPANKTVVAIKSGTLEREGWGAETVLCDVECWRFRQMLQQWPSGKPLGAIYYLVHHARLHFLKKSLQSLETHFNQQFTYPLILFHEKEFREHRKSVIDMLNSSDVFFQEVTFQTPSFIQSPLKKNIPCMSSIGYRHMCRFQAKLVYDQPILEGLDYYWRLDDDSSLVGEVKYDLFEYMRDHHIDYGYSWIHLDSHTCTQGLWEATNRYVANHAIKYHFYDQWPPPRIYYNNFEISSLQVWRSDEYKQYIDYIDKQGGIYYHRWGDAPIKGIAVSLFVPKERTHHFKDVPYAHGSYNSLDFL